LTHIKKLLKDNFDDGELYNTARIFNINKQLDADPIRIPNGCIQQKKIAV
jgi:hypothetical protein